MRFGGGRGTERALRAPQVPIPDIRSAYKRIKRRLLALREKKGARDERQAAAPGRPLAEVLDEVLAHEEIEELMAANPAERRKDLVAKATIRPG